MEDPHAVSVPTDFTSWECLVRDFEIRDEVLVVAHPDAGAEVWLDADEHGDLHEHHPSGVAFYPSAIAFPCLPGEARIWVPGGGYSTRGILIDTIPDSGAPIATWSPGPPLPASSSWDIGNSSDTAEERLRLPWGKVGATETWVGLDQAWKEPRTLLLLPKGSSQT